MPVVPRCTCPSGYGCGARWAQGCSTSRSSSESEVWRKMDRTSLGASDLQVPRLGVGAMTWGDPSGLARWTPAKLAYGGAHGFKEEQRALEASVAAGVTLFDTAE